MCQAYDSYFYTSIFLYCLLSFSTAVQYLKQQSHLSVLKSFCEWLQELPTTWLYAHLYTCPCKHYPPHSPTAFHNGLLCTQITNIWHSWQNSRDTWKCCVPFPSSLPYQGSIPTCTCFHSQNLLVTLYTELAAGSYELDELVPHCKSACKFNGNGILRW